MSLTIYHNPRCSKSRETLALLQDRGLSPQVIEYLKTPPTAAELAEILRKLGKPVTALVRKKEAAEAGIDIAGLDEAALLSALSANPAAIERPIVIHNDRAALGRPPESVLEIL